MNKRIVFLLSLLAVYSIERSSFAGNAVSLPGRDARKEALKYCRHTPTYSSEDECKQAVNSRGYLAKKVLDVCKTAPTWKTSIDCLRAGAGHTNSYAAIVCNKAPNWATTIACLEKVADKKLEKSEIEDCDRRTTWPLTIECFEKSGVASSQH